MVVSRNEIKSISEKLKMEGKTVVFTNGCFDILHSGHVFYLREAKSQGDILILGLNSDTSVRRLKGENRPVNPEEDRAIVISELKSIDYVVIFEEDTPLDLITDVVPDKLVKGGDYKPEEVVGKELVEKNGGEVVIIPFVDGKSTTNIIKKINS
jgi:rfaE bifunctional protein nucleotidyltransferase chain/domain